MSYLALNSASPGSRILECNFLKPSSHGYGVLAGYFQSVLVAYINISVALLPLSIKSLPGRSERNARIHACTEGSLPEAEKGEGKQPQVNCRDD